MKAIYLSDMLKPTGVGLIKALATFTKSRKHLRGGGGGRERERERVREIEREREKWQDDEKSFF